jgi:hypothetical protein
LTTPHRYTSEVRFEGRELKSYAEPVTASLLKEGDVYFSVQFADQEMLIPIMEAWVFAGRKLDHNDEENHLYFQDVGSYREESATTQRRMKTRASKLLLKMSNTFLTMSTRLISC